MIIEVYHLKNSNENAILSNHRLPTSRGGGATSLRGWASLIQKGNANTREPLRRSGGDTHLDMHALKMQNFFAFALEVDGIDTVVKVEEIYFV